MSNNDTTEPEVIIWAENNLGRIRLNRPKALNALSHNMVKLILPALIKWRDDAAINAVLIDSTGERAFCAGGDVAAVYRGRNDDPDNSTAFFTDEYNLNLTIGNYPKPFIAFMDGIVMGGGVGLSSHGSHRIVTERTMLAMPECAIGLIPDVGATWLLRNAPGEIGKWMSMTGARLNGADAIYSGFADTYVSSEKLKNLAQNIASGTPVDEAIAKVAQEPPESILAQLQSTIDETFSKPSVTECVAHLNLITKQENAETTEWAKACLTAISHGSPFATTATFEAQILAKDMQGLDEALKLEYRYVKNALASTEFYEGVRAMLIDKDKTPKWDPALLEDVSIEKVRNCFASLGNNDLTLNN